MSYNKTVLVGNVGQEPEVKTFDNGGRIVRFTLATSERWKNKEGEKQEKTEWHNVQCNFDGLIGVVEKYVKKMWKIHLHPLFLIQSFLSIRKADDIKLALRGVISLLGHLRDYKK